MFVNFCKAYIPSGMYRSVERNNAQKSASRQGCILNRMQAIKVMRFSTERSIPDGMQFREYFYSNLSV